MSLKQKTIQKEFSLSGRGLHTGCEVNMVVKPAGENSGIRFIRRDLPNHPVIKVGPDTVCAEAGISRCTSIGIKDATIHTVEHFMAVVAGLNITNLIIEIDNNELPGLDGSAVEFLRAFEKAGILEQNAQTKVFYVKEPLSVELNGCSISIFPSDEFKISYTLNYNHPQLKSQLVEFVINEEIFKKDIAPCRTFCLESEAKELKEKGLGGGANYENTLVIAEGGPIQNTLRFSNECARHKVLDLIGDLSLIGFPIRGHVVAFKSGHTLNLRILKAIFGQKERYEKKGIVSGFDPGDKKEIGIEDVLKILPHRYPFLLVDRVFVVEPYQKAIGIKNVTMNDNFFQGHFPTRPVMPGVLMVEAMAQTAGVIVLTNPDHHGKVAVFMSIDNVKFRKVVAPGDQLLMEVEVVKDKSRICQVRGVARVADEIVAEADMVFSFTDISYLDLP